ncbi:MAG: hypothetical protein IKK75_12490 [Clostridia bacterium]|nr:hypothetical protein [Clostridia bacterium]
MRTFKRMLSIILMTMLLMSLVTFADAGSKPTISQHPEDAVAEPGGKAVFHAKAKGNTATTWRLRSPDGSIDLTFTNAGEQFPALKVSGKNSNKLVLSNIPVEMDGWQIYCRYGNTSGKRDTDMATLTVLGGSASTPPPSGEEYDEIEEEDEVIEGQFVPAEGEKVLTTVNCTIHFIDSNGKNKGDGFASIDFTEPYYNAATGKTAPGGSIDVKITADDTADYWVINGAKYVFGKGVKSFTLRKLTYGMTVEAVRLGDLPVTLKSDEAIQQARTGAPLQVISRSARMSFLDENDKVGGEKFKTFDFMKDFTNLATGETEDGGRISLRVTAVVPQYKAISYWLFNDARLNFNSDVTWFRVYNLNESMAYQPVFYGLPTPTPKPTPKPTPTPTPVPKYSVSCKNCTFSGGGYSGASSGTVPYGTKITITPYGNSYLGWWSGSYGSGEVQKKSISWTVKSNCSFYWHEVIN